MIILAIEFFALVAICYMFFVYFTRNRIPDDERKPLPFWVVGAAILIPLAMILLASWYVRLGLAD